MKRFRIVTSNDGKYRVQKKFWFFFWRIVWGFRISDNGDYADADVYSIFDTRKEARRFIDDYDDFKGLKWLKHRVVEEISLQ